MFTRKQLVALAEAAETQRATLDALTTDYAGSMGGLEMQASHILGGQAKLLRDVLRAAAKASEEPAAPGISTPIPGAWL